MTRILTIGHSTHDPDAFADFLVSRGVTDLIDVRSKPFSRFNPGFNMERFHALLAGKGITYIFRGADLGGYAKPDEHMALTIDRMASYYARRPRQLPAMMCSEGPACECHRHHWITRHLFRNTEVQVTNIHPSKPDEDPRTVPFVDGFNDTPGMPWPILRPWRVEAASCPAHVTVRGYATEAAARSAVKKACPVQASPVNVYQVK